MKRLTALALAISMIVVAVPAFGVGATPDIGCETVSSDACALEEASTMELPSPTPRVIVTDERWEKVDRNVTRPIVIASGGQLTITSSSLDFQVTRSCSVTINGQGCIADIQVEEGGKLVVENSTVTSTLDNLRERGRILATSGEILIEDSEIFEMIYVRAQGDGHLEFRDNHVHDMFGEIGIWRGATGVIEESLFEDQSGAVSAQDASPEIRNNTFRDIGKGRWAVRVQQSVVGDKAFTTAPLVVDNVFNNTDQGIFTDSGSGFLIAHNRFDNVEGHAVHIRIPTHDEAFTMLDREPPKIQDNVFEENHRQIRVFTVPRDEPSVHSVIEITGNLIQGTECNHIQAEGHPNATLTVSAPHNWWDGGAGPRDPAPDSDHCGAFDGSATFDISSVLRAPPLDAGPRTLD